ICYQIAGNCPSGLVDGFYLYPYNRFMFDAHRFLVFLAAAVVLAVTPGPGIFYVLARSLAGGRREGVHSSVGTFAGGLFHVFAASLGVSARHGACSFRFCPPPWTCPRSWRLRR